MNLRPVPHSATVEELRSWCQDLYRFLQAPAFHVILLVPRTAPESPEEGDLYYDSAANKLKLYNGASWETVTSS